MAAISFAGTSSLAILLKGSSMTLPDPSAGDRLMSLLAARRSLSAVGSGLSAALESVDGADCSVAGGIAVVKLMLRSGLGMLRNVQWVRVLKSIAAATDELASQELLPCRHVGEDFQVGNVIGI
jgi:hypothetical protein